MTTGLNLLPHTSFKTLTKPKEVEVEHLYCTWYIRQLLRSIYSLQLYNALPLHHHFWLQLYIIGKQLTDGKIVKGTLLLMMMAHLMRACLWHIYSEKNVKSYCISQITGYIHHNISEVSLRLKDFWPEWVMWRLALEKTWQVILKLSLCHIVQSPWWFSI